ncbi:MAG TPA: hypothetical protein EYP59_20030 [Thiotrichaceae bacterium]|nr:hypothetical protein [Thiotrichaceae bacterium]
MKYLSFLKDKRQRVIGFIATLIGFIGSLITILVFFTGWPSIWDIWPPDPPPQSTPLENLAPQPTPREIPQMIKVTGVGFPLPGASSFELKCQSAKRAAEADAKRQLAEQIKGAMIQSVSQFENQHFSNEKLEIRVNASLKLARVIDTKKADDCRIVEVVMEAPLTQ